MKAIILAGGFGSRLSEETTSRPKPLVEIGGKPILWHIMKTYSAHGINEFIICLGYKGYMIKEFFANYHLHMSDVTLDIRAQKAEIHSTDAEPWKVTLVDTGPNSGTGGRLKRVLSHVEDDEAFCFTYGDGVGDVNISEAVAFHKEHGGLATLTATRPVPRFGMLELDGARVGQFEEKPHGEHDWVNGGFFVQSPKVGDLIDNDEVYWEREPMKELVAQNELFAYRHDGFWQPMDTLNDRKMLENLWQSGNPPWKVW